MGQIAPDAVGIGNLVVHWNTVLQGPDDCPDPQPAAAACEGLDRPIYDNGQEDRVGDHRER